MTAYQGIVRLLAVWMVLALPGGAFAVEPDEMLKDPAQEARAREISRGLRCLVCQNESIDESNADLAKDLRVLLRERIKGGDTDKEAVQYIVSRYGDYVLLKPPFKLGTFLLWFGPILLFGAAGAGAFAFFKGQKRRETAIDADLTAEEDKIVDAMLKGDDR